LGLGILSAVLILTSCSSEDGSNSFAHSTAPSNLSLAKSGVIKPKVGDLVPDFVLPDQNGNSYLLSDFSGSYVFLNFWATWCPPCVEELPSLDGLNYRFKSKNFTMVAVSVDDSWKDIHKFLSKLNRRPSFLILRDNLKLVSSGMYGTDKFPESYLIGPKRHLLKKYIGAYNWLNEGKVKQIEDLMETKNSRKTK